MPKTEQIWPEIGIFIHFEPGLAGSYGALLVGWLVVVARGLYLARHLFTLFYLSVKGIMNQLIIALEGARVSLVHDQAVLVATENLCFID